MRLEKNREIKFTSYEKIAESLRQLHIDDAGYRLLDKTDWVVTEKVHGANFVLVTDGEGIRCAKRKAFLELGESFFHYQILLKKLYSQVTHAFALLRERHSLLSQISIYGELFGGGYPHPDVRADPSVKLVQTGVYYAPSVEFYAFDIALETGQNQEVRRAYLDGDRAIEIFEEIGLFYARPLFVGFLERAWDYPIGFDSTIPELLGLPPLADNKAEGVVIKPMQSIEVNTKKGRLRPVLKKKIPSFAEDRRYWQSQKWPDPLEMGQSDRLTLLQWEAFNLVTENRLANAISKIGPIEAESRRQSQQLFRAFVEDILEELHQNQADADPAIAPREINLLNEYIYSEARKLFKQFFKNPTRSSSQ